MSYHLGVGELKPVGLVTIRDVAFGRLQVAPDATTRRAIVEDRLKVPATVYPALDLGTGEAADVDLAGPDGDHAGAIRTDVVVLVALATQLPKRRCAVVDRWTSIGRLTHGLGLVRARARC